MGFWDTVGKAAASAGKAAGKMAVDAGKAAIDNAKDSLEKSRRFQDEYSDRSDSELCSILAMATWNKQYAESHAVRVILSSRGYSEEAISEAANGQR